MKSPKTALKASYALFGIVLVASIITVTVYAQTASHDVQEAVETINKESSTPVKTSDKPSYAKPNANKPTEVTPTPNAPQMQISENKTPVRQAPVERESTKTRPTVPEKTVPLERIPFTNKDVTPGDPESYVGTYGQCPFYENAMHPKGCVPPPDIQCNDDWSHCEYIGTRFEP